MNMQRVNTTTVSLTENTCPCALGNMDKTAMAALFVEQKLETPEIPKQQNRSKLGDRYLKE